VRAGEIMGWGSKRCCRSYENS